MSELRPGGPVAVFDQLLSDLDAKGRNAAMRNKPMMWAYYVEVRNSLIDWFADVGRDDGGFAGASLAISQIAVRDCPTLPPREAADLWAVGVYARRILRAWHGGSETVSLDWLRQRSEGQAG